MDTWGFLFLPAFVCFLFALSCFVLILDTIEYFNSVTLILLLTSSNKDMNFMNPKQEINPHLCKFAFCLLQTLPPLSPLLRLPIDAPRVACQSAV